MKIGVFGDSFADENSFPYENESWINCIRQQGHDTISYGCAGTSIWYSYKNFLRTYKNYTHIVFVYSAINRIYNLPEPLHVFSSVNPAKLSVIANDVLYNNLDQTNKEILEKIVVGHEYARDSQLDKFICQNIFDEVNDIAKKHGKKIVNILPFNYYDSEYNLDLSKRAGPCITSLINVSIKEMPNLFEQSFSDSRSCHLSYENNMALANLVLEFFGNQSTEILDSIKSNRFVYSDEISNRYYQRHQEGKR